MLEHDSLTFIGRTTFRRAGRLFGIRLEDRRQHIYMVGQTGTGKSTLLHTLMRQDLVDGRGFAFIDPHGDLAESLMARVSPEQRARVVHFDVPNPEALFTFNPLACAVPATRPIAAAGLLEVFKKLWPDSWGPRLEHLLRYAFLALVEVPGAALPDVLRLLDDDEYRRSVAERVPNPQVRRFWLREYERYSPGRRAEAISPIQNKVGAFLAHPRLQRILGHEGEPTDLRRVMDSGGVLVVNVAKGRLGQDVTSLFGALVLATLARHGLERADRVESNRPDFAIYLDEFHTFTTMMIAGVLSELRKYGVHFVLAHQYLAQLDPEVQDAVLGNVGTVITFRVGPSDARIFANLFDVGLTAGDLTRLPNHNVYVRLLVEGEPVSAFSAETLVL